MKFRSIIQTCFNRFPTRKDNFCLRKYKQGVYKRKKNTRKWKKKMRLLIN